MNSLRVVLRAMVLSVAFVAALTASSSVARGDGKKRPIDAIENDLVADDPAVRAKAAAELMDRFPDGAVAVPMLVDLLDDESPEVVSAAAQTLQRQGTVAGAAVVSFLSNEKKAPEDVLFTGESVKHLFAFKDQSNHELILGDAGPDLMQPKPGPLVAAALWPTGSSGRRCYLLDVARKHAKDRTGTIAGLVLWIDGTNLARARGFVPPDSDESRLRIARDAIALLRSPRSDLAWAGARLLETMGTFDPSAPDALLSRYVSTGKAPNDPDGNGGELVARATIIALRSFGKRAGAVAPRLLAMPMTPAIADALIAMGRSEDVVKALTGKPEFGFDIACALGRSGAGAKAALPWLMEGLNADWSCREAAVALAKLGPEAAEAVAEVRKVSYFPQPWLSAFVLRVIPDDRDSISRLDANAVGKRWPTDQFDPEASVNAAVRGDAVDALAWLAPHVPATTKALHHALAAAAALPVDEIDWQLVESAVSGICRTKPESRYECRDLLRLSDSWSKRSVRFSDRRYSRNIASGIAKALGAIGDGTASPLLTKWTSGADETIRVPAAQALRRIRAAK